MKCLAQARQGWRRVAANMNTSSYDCFLPAVKLKNPKWPNKTITELIASAFEGRFITSLDHPAIQQLGTLS